MSKGRTEARLRTNQDFLFCTRFLDSIGLKWIVEGKGRGKHPSLVIKVPAGEAVRFHIAGTPRSGGDAALSRLRRILREKKVIG
jgi:hypothetical protein